MKQRLIVATLAALMCGVQAQAQQRSEALEIARATQLRGAVRDVSRDELEKALAGSPDMTINYALDAVGAAAGLFDNVAGLGRWQEVGLFGALAFFTPKSGPESWPAIFAWMPREDAPTPRQANTLFQGMVLGAIESTLPSYSVSLGKWASAHWNLTINGPDCDPCGMYSRMWDGGPPSTRRAPAILGRYPSYRWGGPLADGGLGGYPLVEGLTVEERLQFYQQLSSLLPAWAYIYLPPHEMLLEFPLMFNEGEPLYFIEPAPEGDNG